MGNPTKIQKGTTTYNLTWGEGRMLKGISKDTSNGVTYSYNVDGLRTQKVVKENGVSTVTEYVWGNNGLAGMQTELGTVVVLYDAEGQPVGFSLNDTVYQYVKNLQGDVIRILDENGSTVVEYSYDPWGVPTVTGDTELAKINPCSYRGYDYDEETGYYYLQSRYYDPELGRFISIDAVIDGRNIVGNNLYAYCWNSPIVMADATGYAGSLVLPASYISKLSGALAGMMAGISTSIKAVKTAIASSLLIPVCVAATIVAIAGIVAVVNKLKALYSVANKVVASVVAQVRAKGVNDKKLSGYTVYVIVRIGTTDVVYVGITKNFSARKSAHSRRFSRTSYTMMPIATGLSKSQARAMEQTLITAYGLDTLKNMINSISPSKWSTFKREFNQMNTLIESWYDPE